MATPSVERVRVRAGATRLAAIGAVVVGFMVLLVAKPWPDLLTSGAAPNADGPPPAVMDTPTPAPTREDACPFPSGWQVHVTGRGSDGRVDSWYAAEPVVATGPYDSSIPTVVVVTRGASGLGYCAPLSGDLAAPPGPAATVWRVVQAADAARTHVLRRLELDRAPETSVNGYGSGAVFAAPFEARARDGTWSVSTYVFRLTTADASWERWFSVRVELVRADEP